MRRRRKERTKRRRKNAKQKQKNAPASCPASHPRPLGPRTWPPGTSGSAPGWWRPSAPRTPTRTRRGAGPGAARPPGPSCRVAARGAGSKALLGFVGCLHVHLLGVVSVFKKKKKADPQNGLFLFGFPLTCFSVQRFFGCLC